MLNLCKQRQRKNKDHNPTTGVCASHPVWHSRVHGHSLLALLLDHQVHVVILQDGDHLYLHGSLERMRSTGRDTSGRVQLVNSIYLHQLHSYH